MALRRKYRDIIHDDKNDAYFLSIIDGISPFTMTTKRGLEAPYSLFKAIQYIVEKKIPGDIVECGVWAGGSVILAAMALQFFGDETRRIYLYDTFEGMTRPGDEDIDWDGKNHQHAWDNPPPDAAMGFGGTLEQVRKTVLSTGYPEENFVFVKGDVVATLPGTLPEKIALLRLDTDWYDSTYHELVCLYPQLNIGGILIIDDYGWCLGARKATDQFLAEEKVNLFLSRIDESVRLAVKIE